MTKELYYKKEDAMRAAREHHRLFGGWFGDTHADERTKFTYEDERMRNMSWSGEINAVQVYGCRDGRAGLFAWWED